MYDVQINGPCLSDSIIVDPNESRLNRWDIVSGLCPGTNYTVVVKATERVFSISGAYSRAFTLTTLPGAPSAPRNIVVQYQQQGNVISDTTTSTLSVWWATPRTPNGPIVAYEILWAGYMSKTDCDQPEGTPMRINATDPALLQETISNTGNIDVNEFKNIMVCVRAFTSREAGEWGLGNYSINTITPPKTGGLEGSEGDCRGLIAVAVVAGFAILSSVFMGIVLAVVICKNEWSLCSKEKKKDLVEDLKPVPPHPKFANRTNSTKPLIL